MSEREKLLLKELLESYKQYMDTDPTLDEDDMDILGLCMNIPAGYEDLLQ